MAELNITEWGYELYTSVLVPSGAYSMGECFPGPWDSQPRFTTKEEAINAISGVIENLPEGHKIYRANVIGYAPLNYDGSSRYWA